MLRVTRCSLLQVVVTHRMSRALASSLVLLQMLAIIIGISVDAVPVNDVIQLASFVFILCRKHALHTSLIHQTLVDT